MRYFVLIFMLLQMVLISQCQVQEDFSDGELTSNPLWVGDVSDFIIDDDGMLQLHGEDAGSYYLSTQNSLCDSTEWIIYVRQKFSPSANNRSRIWLMADCEDLGDANGYFLQLGESGSEDVPELFLMEDGVESSVVRCSGPDIHSSSAYVYRVVRNQFGFWSVGIKDENGAFVQVGEGFNDRIQDCSWFSIECKCTSSNTENFYFDDIVIRHTYLDMEPPEAWSVTTKGNDKLVVKFSETVMSEDAAVVSNFTLIPEGKNPVGAGVLPGDGSSVQILFETPFCDGVAYSLEVKNLEDAAGNVMEPSSLWFEYHELKRGAIIISEVMADVNPVPPGLPAIDYLELHNGSAGAVELQDLYLKINDKELEFTDSYLLESREYVVVTDEEINVFSPSVYVDGLSIPNASCEIVIGEKEGNAIGWLMYDRDLHDEYKSDGGWSLEVIDPDNMCGKDNYMSSVDADGGTPGEVNSVFAVNPDEDAPFVANAGVVGCDTIKLFFNEPVFCDEDAAFSISEGYQIMAIFEYEPWDQCVSLLIDPPLEQGTVVQITTGNGIEDCSGNICESEIIKVAKPEPINTGDVVINEILFDPEEGFYDYVELYNCSPKVMALQGLAFSGYDTISAMPENRQDVMEIPMMMFPGEYVLVTKDTAGYALRYPRAGKIKVVLGDFLPTMANEEGSIALLRSNDMAVLDYFVYDVGMHYPVLYSTEGVSLERVSDGVWHSSGELNNFGTPGYSNSQYLPQIEISGAVSVDPKVIIPDNDGRDDIAVISIETDSENEAADVYIYDCYGYRVRVLKENLLLATSNELVWDGTNDSGKIVTAGTYVVVVSFRDRFGIKPPARASIAVGL